MGLDAGEQGNPPSKFERVFRLVDRLVREHIPLTACPQSNQKLCVVRDLREHNLARPRTRPPSRS